MTRRRRSPRTDLYDHGDLLEPGRHLRLVLYRRGRSQLHDQLRGRIGDRLAGPAVVTASSARSATARHRRTSPRRTTGFVNGDTASSLTTAPTAAPRRSCRPPGRHLHEHVLRVPSIRTTRSAYVNGSVTVSPASITVAAASGSITYGGAVPSITASVSGLQNGEARLGARPRLTCSTTATSSSPVGSYPTSCSGGSTPTTPSTTPTGP